MKSYIQTIEQYKAQRAKQNKRDRDSGDGCFLN